jgi:hypothetical protein
MPACAPPTHRRVHVYPTALMSLSAGEMSSDSTSGRTSCSSGSHSPNPSFVPHSIGMHTVPVCHGPDGSVLRVLYPCRSKLISPTWTDSGRTVYARPRPSNVRPSRPLDGWTGMTIAVGHCLVTQQQFSPARSSPEKSTWSLPCP